MKGNGLSAGGGRLPVHLYITYDGLLEPLGGSQVVPYVRGLTGALGIGLHVVSFEKRGDLADGHRVRRLEEHLAAADVRWHPLRYHARPSLPATAWDVAQGVRTGRRILRSGRGCLVHARSYVPGLMALLLKRSGGVPFLFDMRGFWIDERVEGGIWPPGHPVLPVARRVERRLLGEADALVSLTEAGRNVLAAGTPPVDPARIRVIPTCVDLERFRPADDPEEARRRLELPDGPVLIYVGSLGTWYLGDLTFQVGRAWMERSGGAFVVLTRERELARELADRHGVDARVLTVSHGEVPSWLQAADAGLSLVRPVSSKRGSAPTKVGEYLACGLAVAATAVGDLDALLDGCGVAFTVAEDQDPVRVADRLLAAARQPERVPEARQLARSAFGLEKGVAAFAELYRRLSPCLEDPS